MLGTLPNMRALPLVLVLTVALAGCTPDTPTPGSASSAPPTSSPTATAGTQTATATPTAKPAPSAVPSPSAPPAPAALVIPPCETLLTLDQAKEGRSPNTVFIGEFGIDDFDSEPWVATARHAATLTRFCVWGVPNSDAGFSVTVGELGEADRAALMSSLAADGFSSLTMGTVTGMEYEAANDDDIGGTHLFAGNVWIHVPGFRPSSTGRIAGLVLDSMRTANPALGL